MSEVAIFDAINGYLETNIGTIPGALLANVAFLGKTYVPEAETPFISLSMPAIGGKMLSTGTLGVYEWRGIFQLNCYWPIGGGLEEVLQQRDAARGLFPVGLSIATADSHTIRFFAPSVRPLLQGGAWITGPVQCPWFLHEVTA